MPQWKTPVARSFSGAEFREYVASLKFLAWRPRFVVVHNTAIPTLGDWHRYTGAQRMRGFENYYRNDQHWSAGPHLFVADDLIWVFTPLTTSGVHSPSWNSFTWGVEIVGDFDTEAFDGPVKANAIDAIATLHEAAGLDPSTMRPHHDDPKTTHKDCPGANLDMSELEKAVLAELGRRQEGDHGAHESRGVVPAEALRPARSRRSPVRRKPAKSARRGK
jgi:hypothetical protein